ncbi:LPS-assembly protein LptD [Sulfurospirillum deleyianum]|uniref:Organic solvent tolerance protein n=1 Tax=Sulfurospirillum deleyianum (strain ATCC 51133 / DSM 6946 / 5175) TaxID=525898 RepID=D1B018_SULD5|nr:LPS assembly protein LptD [Sulfurospirillum deleyianum]ACZ11635.1 Organic solvent tolerance protein [Sulfurospirillum deleyianum DSM 6946]
MIKLPIRWWSMRIKTLILLGLSLCSLWAAPQEVQDVEVLAQTVTKNGTLVHAVGNVVLYSPKYLITADEAYYDYESGDVELFGNITTLEGVDYASRSGHTKLNLNTDKGVSTPLFFFEEKSNLWIKCENAILNPDTYITQKSIVSSCNTQDPDWKIAFTTGEFNKESKWLHIYNPVFYANDIPVFYLPYFSFSTDTTRRTGLLPPQIGIGGSEGFYYLQPIYFAPAENWDLEVRPQIRTERGEGIHSTYRFVDSPYSSGQITAGYFKEQSDYAKEEELSNDAHYGVRVSYDRSALLSTKYSGIEDGLWVDINYLNDIDYYNTIDADSSTSDKLVTSRVNYYVKKDEDYLGIYAKNYIDTSKESNDDTLQELPTLQYHHFSNPFLLDNLFYSVDYKAKNYTRQEGVTAFQNEVRTPVSLYFSVLEDYLHVNVSENVYMTQVSYGNDSDEGSSGEYFNNYHTFSLYTDLSKGYDTFFHTMYMGVEHTVPSYDKQSGAWSYTYANNELIPLEFEEKNTALKFRQFFYDMDGEKKFSHTIKQAYYYDREDEYGDLENDMKYYLTDRFYVGNTVNYSNTFHQLSRNQVSLTYKDSIYTGAMRYTYVDKSYEHNNEGKDYSYVTFSAETRYFENIDLFATVNYDIEEDIFKSWSMGIKKFKKCWDYSLVYKDVTNPKQTSSGVDSTNKKGVMLMFTLYPMGSMNYKLFEQESEQRL